MANNAIVPVFKGYDSKEEETDDTTIKTRPIFGTKIVLDAKAFSVVGNKIGFFIGSFPGMIFGSAGGGALGVLGRGVVMPIGKPVSHLAMQAVPGSYTGTSQAGGCVERNCLGRGKPALTNGNEETTEQTQRWSFSSVDGEEYNLVLQSLLVDASSGGGQGAVFGAEIGGAITGVLVAVPLMLLGGIVGGFTGLCADTYDYVSYHSSSSSSQPALADEPDYVPIQKN